MNRRTAIRLPVLAASALAAPGVVRAQERFPSRPLQMVIPFTAGGSNDVVGRIVAEAMGQRLGQTIVVENRGGAGGLIGNDIVAKARPDGYTFLLAGSGSLIISSLVQPSVPYDALNDFTPIGFIGASPNVIAVNPSVPARTMAELREVARNARPPLTYGSPGVGTNGHLLPALIALTFGVHMEHIPYRGTAPALNDVLAGRLNLITNALAPFKPHLEAGTLRAIAIASPKRSEAAPEIPTTAEQGFPGIVAATWYGLIGPKGVPADRVRVLFDALNATLADATVKARLLAEGCELEPSESPDAFARFMAADRERWADIVKRAEIRVE